MTTTPTLRAPDAHPQPTHQHPTSSIEFDDSVPVFHATPRPAIARVSPYGVADDVPISDFETGFQLRLTELGASLPSSGPVEPPRRSTITAVVTALRSAIKVDRLLAVARGLTPQDVADAYRYVEDHRASGAAGLARFLDEPTPEVLATVSPDLIRYLPQATAGLVRVARDTPDELEAAADRLATEASVLGQTVAAVEDLVRGLDPTAGEKLVELDDGRNRGVYHHQCYCPRRLGDIVPVRLAYLLGDARQDEET